MYLNHLTYKESNCTNSITILPQATLAWNRVHECKGPSKIIFALWLAQKSKRNNTLDKRSA